MSEVFTCESRVHISSYFRWQTDSLTFCHVTSISFKTQLVLAGKSVNFCGVPFMTVDSKLMDHSSKKNSPTADGIRGISYYFTFYLVHSWSDDDLRRKFSFLADRTNGRAYATVLRLSSVCL